jgi:hypothetical protein
VIRIAYDPAPRLVPKTFNVTIPEKKFQMIMPNTVWRSPEMPQAIDKVELENEKQARQRGPGRSNRLIRRLKASLRPLSFLHWR